MHPYTLAQNALMDFDDENNQELSDWKWLMQVELAELSDSLFVYDSLIIIEIRRIANKCPRELSSVNAASVLFRLYRESGYDCDETSGLRNLITPVNYTVESSAWLKDNYPDPFTNNTLINYYLPEDESRSIFIQNNNTDENYYYLGSNYPNPFRGETFIPVFNNQDEPMSLIISAVDGKIMKEIDICEKDNVIKLSAENWSAGTYYYSIVGSDGNILESHKMVLVK